MADRPGGEELEFIVGAVGGTRPIAGPDRGFCLFAAAAGLQAALAEAGDPEALLRRTVALGGDTDTNAAVAGALVGAAAGAGALEPGRSRAMRPTLTGYPDEGRNRHEPRTP